MSDILFINFLNGKYSHSHIIESVIANSKDEKSKEIAIKKRSEDVDLSYFKNDFKKVVLDLIDNGINQRVINYINSYMKPSLEEFIDTGKGSRVNEDRYVVIKAEDTPWLEAIVCYNLCIYIKQYGFNSIKQCSTCHKFFCHKGQYAKYCSDACKVLKVEK